MGRSRNVRPREKTKAGPGMILSREEAPARIIVTISSPFSRACGKRKVGGADFPGLATPTLPGLGIPLPGLAIPEGNREPFYGSFLRGKKFHYGLVVVSVLEFF